MKKYVLYYSGISRAENCRPELFEGTLKEAEHRAWELATYDYDGYAGIHGIRDVSDIMEEEGLEEEEAKLEYIDERESWIDYYVEEYNPEKHDDELE